MNFKKSVLSIISFILIHFSVIGHEILTEWRLDKESGDTQIFYRDVEVGDTLKTRQMRVTFYLEAIPENIVPMFKQADMLSLWSAGVEKCEVLRNNNSSWLTYSKYNFPWPFKQEDLIAEYKMDRANSRTILSYISGTPDQLPYYESVPVTRKYEGQWLFVPQENGTTKVEFYSIAFFKSRIPHFIQDPIVQEILIESINYLKYLVTVQESKRIIAFDQNKKS